MNIILLDNLCLTLTVIFNVHNFHLKYFKSWWKHNFSEDIFSYRKRMSLDTKENWRHSFNSIQRNKSDTVCRDFNGHDHYIGSCTVLFIVIQQGNNTFTGCFTYALQCWFLTFVFPKFPFYWYSISELQNKKMVYLFL